MSEPIHLVVGLGGDVKSLYRDELRPVYDALGRLEIPGRASDIVFHAGKWYVCEFDGTKKIKDFIGFHTRAEAIEREIQILQQKYL